MLVGVTPFHSYEMKDLIAKINDGRYKLSLNEPVCVETCLFLVQCMQMNEADRVPINELGEHPFIADDLLKNPRSPINIILFNEEMSQSKSRGSISSMTQDKSSSAMTSRFDDTVIKDTDVILTTKASDQVRILLSQLVNSTAFTDAQFDMSNSVYFNKYYDTSMLKQFKIESSGNVSIEELANNMRKSIRDNHFDSDAPNSRDLEGPGSGAAAT